MDDYDEISGAKVLIIPGHSEYWTRQARLNFDKFVDGDGVNPGKDAIILSGNTMWWQVRYEDDNGNPQLVCHRGTHWGSYDDDPVANISDPEYHPLHATYHWGEPSLKYSILGSIGSDWLRGGYGVDVGISTTIPCYEGYNGFKVTSPGSPILNGMGYDLHDFIHFATGEYDGTLVKIDNDGNLIPDANGDPQLDISALGFYRAEMIGYDVISVADDQAGGFPDPGNTNAINVCPFMVFQKTCTSGTIINVNSNEWCSNWVIGHGETNEINPKGNLDCYPSNTLIPDANIPQITDNMINLVMQDQAQNLSGNNLFYNSPPSSPSIIIKPAYSNVSYNICSGGLIDITPCGVYLTEGYKVDHGFRWNQSSIESASTNLHNVHYSYLTSACTDYNNGDLARPQDNNNNNNNNTVANSRFSGQIPESNGNLSSIPGMKTSEKIPQKNSALHGNALSEINIFPNPNQGIFILQFPIQSFSNSIFTITNALGEKIIEQKIISNKTEINLSNQPAGIYFLKAAGMGKMAMKKIVKM